MNREKVMELFAEHRVRVREAIEESFATLMAELQQEYPIGHMRVVRPDRIVEYWDLYERPGNRKFVYSHLKVLR